MSTIRIFIDFGSTFTKVVAFDLEKEELVARVQAPTTVDTDIMTGLNDALRLLRETVDVTDEDIKNAVACSSAAGGLRMVCIGLVPEYTTEAGRLAALGAGAKVVGTFSYEMSRSEQRELEELAPDIVLLTGGTDGGNKKNILHNAEVLARTGPGVRNIIIAGNKSAHDDLHEIFDATDKNVVYTKNVMPEFGRLDIDPVNEMIRDMFISRITEAKGITRVRDTIGSVVMPTPSAVLEAARVLADGTYKEPGLGELMLVDVGGATTDVHSVAAGTPHQGGVAMVGLPEPYAKRSVEGDLGMFHNLDTLVDIAKQEGVEFEGEITDYGEVMAGLKKLLSIPKGDEQTHNQMMLARLAVKTAVNRHAGRIELQYTRNGEVWLQHGKDLTEIKTVIGAGGPLAFSADARYVLEGAARLNEPAAVLKPEKPQFWLDRRYILFAIGLLSLEDKDKAIRIFKKYMEKL